MNDRLSFEEYLDREGTLTYTNTGSSMLPLLREGKDLFTVRKKDSARCRAGDVILYRRGKSYVLHRVIEVRPSDYVVLGDNCMAKEYVTDDRILGVMTGFVRDGKQHAVTEKGYRLYTWLCLHGAGLRIFLKRAMWRVKSILRKILGIQRTKV